MCFQLCLSSRIPNASIYRAFHIPIRWLGLLCFPGTSICSSNSAIFDTSLLQTHILCVCLGKFTVTAPVSFPKPPVCLILRLVILRPIIFLTVRPLASSHRQHTRSPSTTTKLANTHPHLHLPLPLVHLYILPALLHINHVILHLLSLYTPWFSTVLHQWGWNTLGRPATCIFQSEWGRYPFRLEDTGSSRDKIASASSKV